MKEELVSFETARLLKEKGFSLSYPSACYYNNELWISENLIAHSDIKKIDNNYLFKAPTQSLAQRWLREKHDIHVTVLPYDDVEVNQILWENRIIDIKDDWNETSDYTYYHTYEEALEEGLRVGLNLIK